MTAARKIAKLPRLDVGEGDDWNAGLVRALAQPTAPSRVDALLDLGRHVTGLSLAIVANVYGDAWQLQTVRRAGPPSALVPCDSLCQYTLASGGVAGSADLLNSGDLGSARPLYGAWIGAPIGSNSVVAFASEFVRDAPFSSVDVARVRLIAALLHRDIQLHHELDPGARFDALTGLPTLLGVQHKLTRLLSRSAYLQEPIMTMIVDLDDFSSFTLQHGEAVGDQVLRDFGRRLEDAVRPRDIVARLDRDTFLAILPDAELEHVRNVADRVRIAMSTTPIQTDNGPLIVPCSVGVVAAPPDDNQVESLLGKCYDALRMSKLAGKGRVTVLL